MAVDETERNWFLLILIDKKDGMVVDKRIRVAWPSVSANARSGHAIYHRTATARVDVAHCWA